jgi:ATP-dependent DNA helicase RecQ
MKIQYPIRINQSRDTEPLDLDDTVVLRLSDFRRQAPVVLREIERLKDRHPEADWTHFAVLTRTRRVLAGIRSFLEAQNIPISWKLDTGKSFSLHRIREIDRFLERLKEIKHRILPVSSVRKYNLPSTSEVSKNMWHKLLDTILDNFQTTTMDADLPVQDFIDYVYDALMENRREHRIGQGVYLGTMHSAKGMEFPHVLIPDGGWRVSPTADNIEEERRLFYVAMTRAMHSLSLISAENSGNPHIGLLNENNWRFRDAENFDSTAIPPTTSNYDMIGLKDLYLGYPGRFDAYAPIQHYLSDLHPGDPVTLIQETEGITIRNTAGQIVSKLSKAACETWSGKLSGIKQATVFAMIRRFKQDESTDRQKYCRCDQWELPIIEVLIG